MEGLSLPRVTHEGSAAQEETDECPGSNGQKVVNGDGQPWSSGPIAEVSWAASDQPCRTGQEAGGGLRAYDPQEK